MSIYKNDINVSLNIGANTQQAQQQIQALQASLNKLSASGTGSGVSAEMQKAAAAAQELQMHLSKAYNTKTGNLDLSLLNKSLATSKEGIQGLSASLINAGKDGQAAFVNLAKSIASANQPMLKTNTLLTNMWTTLKNTARWQISSSILQGFMGSIQKAYQYAQDLNKSLTDIRIVTGYSADKMSDFAAEANKAAKALSTTTNEYAKASLIYFQQGLNDQEVKERTDVTVKMANVTRDSAQVVSDQMTAIWNNFDDGSKSLEYYADVITALGAATASSTDEIAQGLEKFAAVASTVGLSYEYATSALATITAETRQSADVVGTALKTLFARIQGLSLGETLDDGTDLNKYSEALAKIGISIKDSNGGLKDMDTLLEEMAAKWQTLNKDQQVALAQTVAGVRQYTQLVALMDNWGAMQTNLNTAANSEGTLQEQQDIYAESWEAASKRAKAALEEIYSTILDDTFFIKLTDTFAVLISGIGDLVKGLGGMKGVLAIVASIFLANFAHKIPEALNGAWYNIKVLFGGAKKEAEAFKNDMNKIFAETQTSSNFTQAQKVEITAAQNLMNARYAYEKVSSKLTASEKMQADIRLAALEKEQQQWIDLTQSIEQYQSILATKETSINGSNLAYQLDKGVNKAWNNQNNYNFDAYTEGISIFEKKALGVADNVKKALQDAMMQGTKFDMSSVNMQSILEPLTSGLNKIKEIMSGKGPDRISNDVFNGYKQSILDFANALPASIKKSEEFQKALQTLGKEGAVSRKEITDAIDSIIKSTANLNPKNFEEYKKVLEDLLTKTLGTAKTQEIINNIEKLKKATDELPAAANKAKAAYDNFINGIRHIPGTIEKIGKAAGGLSSIAMAFNSFKNAFDTIKNPDISGFEKFTSILLSVSMCTTMAINGFKALSSLYTDITGKRLIDIGVQKIQIALDKVSNHALNDKIALSQVEISYLQKKRMELMINNVIEKYHNGLMSEEKALHIINNILTFLGVKEEQKEILSKKILNGELTEELFLRKGINKEKVKETILDKLKNSPKKIIGWLKQIGAWLTKIGAILPVILNLALLIAGAIAWYNNTPEKRLEKAKKVTEEAKTAAEEAKAAYDDLKSTIEDFQSGIDKISELAKGTEEFAKAVQESNEKARELIDTLGLVEGVNIDSETGLITFDEGVLEKAEQEAYLDKQAANARAKAAEIQQNDVENENLIHQFARKNIFGDLREDRLENAVENGIENGSFNTQVLDEFYNGKIGSKDLAEILGLSKGIIKGAFNEENKDEVYELISALEKNTGSNNLLNDTLANDILLENEDYKNSRNKNDIRGFLEREDFTISGIQDEMLSDGKWIDLDLVKEAFDADEVTKTIFGQYKIKIGDEVKKISEEEAAAAAAGIQYIRESGEKVGNAIETVASIISAAGENSGLASVFFQEDGSAGGDTLANDFRMNPEEFRDDVEAIFNTEREYFISQGYADADALYQYYVSLFEGYDPFAKMKNVLKDQLSTEGFEMTDSDFENWSSQIKQWWDQLSDEDKTLALQLDFINGEDLDQQLKEFKEKAQIDEIYARTAEATEWSEEAIRSYAQSLMATNKALADNELLAAKAAEQNLNFAKGAQDASQILEDQAEVIKKADKNSMEYHEAIGELTASLNQMLGAKFDSKFLQDTKNMEKFKKAVKGDTDAIKELRKEAAKTIIAKLELKDENLRGQLESLVGQIQDSMNNLQVGDSISQSFIDQLNQMVQAAGMTKEQIEALMNSMGLHAEIEMEVPEVGIEEKQFQNTTEATTTIDGKIHNIPIKGTIHTSTTTDSDIQYPVIKNATVASTPKSLGGAAKSNPAPKSGGGGGGGGQQLKDPKNYEDEIERYHENTRALERLERALEKVTTAKDRAFGKERLRLIDEEIAATERLAEQQKQYLAEIEGYAAIDRSRMEAYGFTFDEYGEITNYNDVYRQQVDKFNASRTDAAEEAYNKFEETVEQYEETITLLDEEQMKYQEYLNSLVDLKLEKITTEVEVKIRVNDIELTKLEYMLKKLQREGAAAADEIKNIADQINETMEKAGPIQEAIDKIYEQARAEGRGLNAQETAEIQSFYADGVIDAQEQERVNAIYAKADAEDRMLTQAEEDQIQEYKEQLLELNEEVWELADAIEGKLAEELDELGAEFDENLNRLTSYTQMYENLQNVLELTGKSKTAEGLNALNQLAASTLKNSTNALKANKANYDTFVELAAEANRHLQEAIEVGDQHMIDYWTEQVEDVTIKMEEAHVAMLESFNDALEAAGDLFDTKVQNMITKLKKDLGDLDTMVELYDRAVELENLYLSSNQSIYELSKLTREIGKSIEDTSNLIAKNKLNDLMKELNKLRAEGVQLSKYDLEYLQAKYELELAEIALQEAQEAKSQVKLTRNNEGGWGYVYTADSEKVAEAEQNFEDKSYNMQQLNADYITNYSEQLLKNRQEMMDALANIDKTREDYDTEVLRVKEEYMAKEEFYINELTKAYERQGVTYEETILGMISNDESLLESHENFKDRTLELIDEELIPAHEEWLGNVQDVCDEAGYSYDELTDGVLENMDNVNEASAELTEKTLQEQEDMRESMKETMQEIKNWQLQYLETIDAMVAANEAYYDKTIADYTNAMNQIVATAEAAFDAVVNAAQAAAAAVAAAAASIDDSMDDINNYTPESEGKYKVYNSAGDVVYSSDNLDNAQGYVKTQQTKYYTETVPNAIEMARNDYYQGKIDEDRLKEVATAAKNSKAPSYKITTGATGMYTGSWGSEGKLAILHEKELVLNKYDTKNMLDMVNTLRDIDWRAKLSELWTNIEDQFINPVFGGTEELLQQVHIEANFPDLKDHFEIEEAFHNLINTASQYANRKRI